MRTLPSVSALWTKSAWPLPAGHQSTRQWLRRSDWVLPPWGLRRMNEFSPVMRTFVGSTGLGMGPILPSLHPSEHLDPRNKPFVGRPSCALIAARGFPAPRLRLDRRSRPLRHRDRLVGHPLLRLPGPPPPDGGRPRLLARRDHGCVLGGHGRGGPRRAARRPVDRP